MEEKTSLTLPAKLNLFDMVTIEPFENTPKYHKFLKREKNSKKTKTIVNLVLWLLLIGTLAYFFYTGHGKTFLFWAGGIIAVIVCGIFTSWNASSYFIAAFAISKANEAQCKPIIDELIQNNFTNAKYIFSWGKALIYNNDIFAYISVNEKLLLVYDQQNFKQGNYKRVTGTHDYGDIYEFTTNGRYASTVGYLGKGYKDEFLIEIMTNYLEYPVVRLVVPATNVFENEIKNLFAILA